MRPHATPNTTRNWYKTIMPQVRISVRAGATATASVSRGPLTALRALAAASAFLWLVYSCLQHNRLQLPSSNSNGTPRELVNSNFNITGVNSFFSSTSYLKLVAQYYSALARPLGDP